MIDSLTSNGVCMRTHVSCMISCETNEPYRFEFAVNIHISHGDNDLALGVKITC